MNGYRDAAAVGSVLLLFVTGCSSIVSQTSDSRIYGGVRVNRYLRAEASDSRRDGWGSLAWTALLYIDLPLSAVMDTLLLPGTTPMALLSAGAESIPEEADFIVAVESRALSRPWLWWAHHYTIVSSDGAADSRLRQRYAEWTPSPEVKLSKARRMRRRLDFKRHRLHAVFTGDQAKAIDAAVREKERSYRKKRGGYRAWPGPNSNTLVATMAREIQGLSFHMDHNACGKDYTRFARLGFTTSRTGLSLDTLPFGIAVGLVEGVEIHFLALTFGVSVFPPAIEIPFLQRLGFPAWVVRD